MEIVASNATVTVRILILLNIGLSKKYKIKCLFIGHLVYSVPTITNAYVSRGFLTTLHQLMTSLTLHDRVVTENCRSFKTK